MGRYRRKNQRPTLTDTLESLFKSMTLILSVAYACGLVINNIHLSRIDYSDTALLKQNLIFTGLWPVLTTIFFSMVFASASKVVDGWKRPKGKFDRIIELLMGLVLVILAISTLVFVVHFLTQKTIDPRTVSIEEIQYASVILLLPLIFSIMIRIALAFREDMRKFFPGVLDYAPLVWPVIVFFTSMFLLFHTYFIHPKISFEFGGGQIRTVDLRFKERPVSTCAKNIVFDFREPTVWRNAHIFYESSGDWIVSTSLSSYSPAHICQIPKSEAKLETILR